MKRLLAFFIAIVFTIFPLTLVSYSKEESVVFSFRHNYESSSRHLDSFYSFIGSEIDSFDECILDAVAAGEERIDVSAFGIPGTENMCNEVSLYIWKELPSAFNVYAIGIGTIGPPDQSFIDAVYVSYYVDCQTYVDMLEACEKAAETLLFGIKDNASLTQVEKALLIHDRIIASCEYSLNFGPNCYNMYGVLVENSAVCEGYTMAYKYLLDQVGIQSFYCSSEKLDHAWNIVILDGEAYHVDNTWDDPILDIPGRVWHNNFLRSSEGFFDTDHDASDYDQTPSSTKYDRAYWQNSSSEFQLIGNDIYFLDNTDEYLCKVADNVNERVLSINDTWSTLGGYYSENFSRLSSSCKTLLYSLSDAVYSYSVKNGQSQMVFKPALSPGEAIYGMRYDGERITCYLGNSPTEISRTVLKPYTVPEEEHTFENAGDVQCDICGAMRDIAVPGDLNGKNGVDSDDAIYLLYSTLLGEARYPLNQNCDFNEDGIINSDDAIYLLYHTLLGAERYPLS